MQIDAKLAAVQAINQAESRNLHRRMGEVEKHVELNIKHLTEFDTELKANTKSTIEVLTILQDAKGFYKIAKWVGDSAKWVLGLAASALVLWVTIRDMMVHK